MKGAINMSKCYIAAPFFNDKQLQIVEDIKAILEKQTIEYFSPKDESMFKQGDDPKQILKLNCRAIEHSDFVIVVTDDKDVGTIWEAGYSFAFQVPILYVWLSYEPHMKFNIMLAASGDAVVHTYADLVYQLQHYIEVGEFKQGLDGAKLHE